MASELFLDLKTINELQEILEENFEELFVVFKENSRINIDKLSAAYDKNNAEDMLSYAHILKGSCGSLGLARLYDLMMNLEIAIEKNESAEINSLMDELELLYASTLNALIEHKLLAG